MRWWHWLLIFGVPVAEWAYLHGEKIVIFSRA